MTQVSSLGHGLPTQPDGTARGRQPVVEGIDAASPASQQASVASPDAPQPYSGPMPYSVKRHGLTLANCASEPVQAPGCVQAHGALLLLRLSDLSILQASDNSLPVLGQAPHELLGRPVGRVIGPDGTARLRAALLKQSGDCNPLYLMTLPAAAKPDGMAGGDLDVTVHTVDGAVILELEATGHGGSVDPDYYALVKKTVARLQASGSLQQLCDSAAREIRELTGLDRVMVYKFHEDHHGEVYAESMGPGLAPWLGLHYPASDIPRPAREVYGKTWIRPIPDISGALAEMLPLVNPDTGAPLNMTYCALRGVSIMCTEQHQNMGVKATLTLSIRRGDRLWGLIACHHYGGPKFLSYQVRAACEFVAQVVSLQHQAADDREHAAYRIKLDDVHQSLVQAAAQDGGLAAIVDSTPSLLDGIDAGGAALFHLDRWWMTGRTPDVEQLQALGAWLKEDGRLAGGPRVVYASDHLARDYPPAAAFADVASGVLAVPLSGSGRNLMLWFRPETLRTVSWGGDPHDKIVARGPNGPRLTARRSFELFVESVHQRALPWKPVEVEAAARLRLLLVEMVVDRAERLSDLNADLARSNEELDAFAYVASHDLKEPLRGIHKYAWQLLADAALVDEKDRSKLDRLMRLTLRMDSLLDSLLHFSRVGRADLSLEPANLDEVVAEAAEMVGFRSLDGLSAVTVPRPLPTVQCNRVGCREVFVNLLSNALKYTDRAQRLVEVGFIGPDEIHLRPGCPPGSADHTIFYVADNGIGIHQKHYDQVFKLFKRLHGRDEYGGGTGAGLTIVRKLVERHRGRVWLDSQPGQGSVFYFTLPPVDAV